MGACLPVFVVVTFVVLAGAVFVTVEVRVLTTVLVGGGCVIVVVGVEVTFVVNVMGMLMVYVVVGTTGTDDFPSFVMQNSLEKAAVNSMLEQRKAQKAQIRMVDIMMKCQNCIWCCGRKRQIES